MAHGEPVLYSLYIYAPNKVAPIIFTVLFAASTSCYVWQCIRYQSFKLTWLHLLSASLFTLGYALREYGAYNYLYEENNSTPLIVFILSQVFIYVCPPLLELANYHTLGRIFHYVPYHAPIPAGKVLGIFGGLMAVVELLNALGVALASNPSSDSTQQSLGGNLTIAALSIQLAVILIFVCLAVTFHRRCIRSRMSSPVVRSLLFVLYASMMLIFLRCIYRLVEHVGPTNKDLTNIDALRALSPLFRYEVYFYIFEATFMLINSILWNIWNPGRLLPADYHVYLGRDGTELLGQKDADLRPMWAKLAHILSFGLLFPRKRTNHAAHELPGRAAGNGGALYNAPVALGESTCQH
ncbi:RTA1 domain-containing protein [Purpureocillium lavendulum]|uniref:RTA1 domain-containing protein n=1 Tax=Purpureocillium lavendulum TaxID=1247861 RepID=A0AB34FJ11_9HYPO|nr:RTA1 domain-containing protein [Purpureocillium lavendulum]